MSLSEICPGSTRPLKRGHMIYSDLNTFFKEWKEISETRSSIHYTESTSNAIVSHPLTEDDVTESEIQEQVTWLKDAGMEELANKMEADYIVDKQEFEESVSWMSEKQAKVIKRRVDNLSSTIKRRRIKRNSRLSTVRSNELDGGSGEYHIYDNYFNSTLENASTKMQYKLLELSGGNYVKKRTSTVPDYLCITDSMEVSLGSNSAFERESNPLYVSIPSNEVCTSAILPSPLDSLYVDQKCENNHETALNSNLFISSPVFSNNDLNYHLKSPQDTGKNFDPYREDGFMSLNVHLASPPDLGHRRMTKSISDSQLFNSGSYASLESSSSSEYFTIESSPIQDQAILPEATLLPESLGITRFGDLHNDDIKQIGSLAHIELAAIFDSYNICPKKMKQPRMRNNKESGIFGLSLEQLIINDQKEYPDLMNHVPIFLDDICSRIEKQGLQEEGLMRIPGNHSRIKQIIANIDDNFSAGNFSWNSISTKDLSSILKQFLREMPSPLVTYESLDTFLTIHRISDFSDQLKALNYLILTLPRVNSAALKRILEFVRRVVDKREYNKMDLTNCSLVMAPNLFYGMPSMTNSRQIPENTTEEIRKANIITRIMKMLIKYQDIIWIIPNHLINQLRENTMRRKPISPASQKKFMFKRKFDFLKRITHSQMKETQQHIIKDHIINNCLIIRIQSPLFIERSRAFKVSNKLTAGQIVSDYLKRANFNRELIEKLYPIAKPDSYGCYATNPLLYKNFNAASIIKEDFHLYEFSGNITIRKLDPSSKIINVRESNPQGIFIILPHIFTNPDTLLEDL